MIRRSLLVLLILCLIAGLGSALSANSQNSEELKLITFYDVKIIKAGNTSTYDSLSLIASRCNASDCYQTIRSGVLNKLKFQILLLYVFYDREENVIRSRFLVLNPGDYIAPSKIEVTYPERSWEKETVSEIIIQGKPGEPFNEEELNNLPTRRVSPAELAAEMMDVYFSYQLSKFREEKRQLESLMTIRTETTTKTITKISTLTITTNFLEVNPFPDPETMFMISAGLMILAVILALLLIVIALKRT